jgi:hypothetical protein
MRHLKECDVWDCLPGCDAEYCGQLLHLEMDPAGFSKTLQTIYMASYSRSSQSSMTKKFPAISQQLKAKQKASWYIMIYIE